jgi:hypothetical protein
VVPQFRAVSTLTGAFRRALRLETAPPACIKRLRCRVRSLHE